MEKNQLCLICHEPIEKSWHLFCDRCLHMDIVELDRLYRQRASDTLEDERKPQVNNPSKEDAHKL